MSSIRFRTFVLSFLVVVSSTARADEEPSLAQLRETFQQPYLRVGAVVQTVGDVVFDRAADRGHDGFSLATARLSLRGQLDGGYAYLLQTDFTRSPALLDARLTFAFAPELGIDAGLFKAPFSAEFLIPAPSIDFVNRSQAVSALSPGREVGVALFGEVANLSYRVGAFNGNGRDGLGGNDDGRLLTVGRLATERSLDEGRWEVGVNGAIGDDPDRERALWGADTRLQRGRWLLSGEILAGLLDPDDGAVMHPVGYQVTAGYMLIPDRHQVLVRWDALDLDDGSGNRRFVVLGYNYWPTGAFEWQLNYLVPVRDGDLGDQQVLANFQIAF